MKDLDATLPIDEDNVEFAVPRKIKKKRNAGKQSQNDRFKTNESDQVGKNRIIE